MNTKETRRIVNLEKSINRLEARISSLQKENENLKDVIKFQSIFNGKLNEKMDALTKRKDEMNNLPRQDLQNSQNDIQDIKKSLQSLQQNVEVIKKQIDELNDTIRNITTSGSTSTTPETENPEEPDFPSDVDLMNYKPYLSPNGSINYKVKDKLHHVPPKVVKTALEATTLKDFFKAFSLPIKDNRPKGGSFWVKGSSEELAPFVGIAYRKFACNGTFTDNGRATGFQIGWFTHSRR